MKSIPLFLVALLLSVSALAAEPVDRPIGVEPANWIPVTDKLGFVVVAAAEATSQAQLPTPMNPQVLLNKVSPEPPAAGYFMIKGAEGWRRLVVLGPADLVSAAKG